MRIRGDLTDNVRIESLHAPDSGITLVHSPSLLISLRNAADALETAKIGKSITLNDSIDINARIRNLSHPDHLEFYKLTAVFNGETTVDGTLDELLNAGMARPIEGGYAVCVASAAAAQMTDIVHVVFSYVEKPDEPTVLGEFDYSVRQYCETMITNPKSDEALIALCTATLDYGAYAQQNFQYKIDDLANANYSAGEDLIAAVKIPESYNISAKAGACTGISGVGRTANLLSATELRIRFKPDAGSAIGNYSFTVNDTPVQATEEGGRYVVKITGIAAPRLDTGFTVTVTNNNDNSTMTVIYSATAYAYSTHTTGGVPSLMAKALFRYFVTAKAYFIH